MWWFWHDMFCCVFFFHSESLPGEDSNPSHEMDEFLTSRSVATKPPPLRKKKKSRKTSRTLGWKSKALCTPKLLLKHGVLLISKKNILKRNRNVPLLPSQKLIISVIPDAPCILGIFTYIWLKLMVNVGRYSCPMEHMGMVFCFFCPDHSRSDFFGA